MSSGNSRRYPFIWLLNCTCPFQAFTYLDDPSIRRWHSNSSSLGKTPAEKSQKSYQVLSTSREDRVGQNGVKVEMLIGLLRYRIRKKRIGACKVEQTIVVQQQFFLNQSLDLRKYVLYPSIMGLAMVAQAFNFYCFSRFTADSLSAMLPWVNC